MEPRISSDFIAVGGNRHPAAADWDAISGLVAFGADRNVALWDPLDSKQQGIRALLCGHTDQVTVVTFYNNASLDRPYILSGSVDKTIRVWSLDLSNLETSRTESVIADSDKTINAIAVDSRSGIFVSGSADTKINVRRIEISDAGSVTITALQTLSIVPRFFPLALALSPLQDSNSSLILAVAGTKNIIQIYTAPASDGSVQFQLHATLTGHEGWIRCLAFTRETDNADADLLLASASQDKYIRLWRVHQGDELPPAIAASTDPALGVVGKSLSNKAHRFRVNNLSYSVTFEALLLGHDDWIYRASWFQRGHQLLLQSASADGSLAIWEPERSSGVWVCLTRLGEISGQKGATTATGSAGGYWIGLWSPSGKSVISLGRTGGWRLWQFEEKEHRWSQKNAVSGHVKAVTAIAWPRDGSYLLSTSLDQTTRLFAEWKRDGVQSWHELSRPQIHGYDLNCIGTLGASQFVSGADEKLLRVFAEPRAVADMLQMFCQIQSQGRENLPDAADIHVLGLSNKAARAADTDTPLVDGSAEFGGGGVEEVGSNSSMPLSARSPLLSLPHPPTEDHLARHTLWPEREKLYGHGYEISTLATSHDNTLVATACRASSVQHAAIRLYETQHWREIKPPLAAHNLTVTRLRFSPDDRFLLSVGRDRQWFLFRRDEENAQRYIDVSSNPKGHSRMLLDATWAPAKSRRIFVTAGRDKSVKIWTFSNPDPSTANIDVTCKATITVSFPVTAIDCLLKAQGNSFHLAMGLEDGSLGLYTISQDDISVSRAFTLPSYLSPSRSITQLAWRPDPSHGESDQQRSLQANAVNGNGENDGQVPFDTANLKAAIETSGKSDPRDEAQGQEDCGVHQLAVASEDGSVRILSIRL